MDQIVGIVLPVFGLIGIGYALAWTRTLGYETGEALGDFVFTVAIPVLIFSTIVGADFSAGEPWRLWLPFFAAFGLSWIAGTVLIRRGFGRDHRAGLVGGIASAYGNTVLIGLPLVLAAYGQEGAVPLALIIAIHMPVMMGASAIMIGRAERLDAVSAGAGDMGAAMRTALRHLATSPIILAILAGAAWRLTGVPLAGIGGDLVGRVAGVAGTLALIAMGMSVRRYGVRRNVAAGLALAALKLLLMPALVLATVGFMGLPPVWAKVAVIAAACPTGVNSYLVAGRFRTGEALASNAIAISTGIAVVTTAFWLNVVEWALPS